jgi:hypothetical protein
MLPARESIAQISRVVLKLGMPPSLTKFVFLAVVALKAAHQDCGALGGRMRWGSTRDA